MHDTLSGLGYFLPYFYLQKHTQKPLFGLGVQSPVPQEEKHLEERLKKITEIWSNQFALQRYYLFPDQKDLAEPSNPPED